MKENKRYIIPVTEEQFHSIWTLAVGEEGYNKKFFQFLFEKLKKDGVINPLPSSITEITNNMDRSDIIRIETQAYDNGYRAGLMANKTTLPSFPSDEEKLTDSDKWFSANLICLLDLEKQLVKEGKQEVIDREMIFEWVSAFKEQTKNKGGEE